MIVKNHYSFRVVMVVEHMLHSFYRFFFITHPTARRICLSIQFRKVHTYQWYSTMNSHAYYFEEKNCVYEYPFRNAMERKSEKKIHNFQCMHMLEQWFWPIWKTIFSATLWGKKVGEHNVIFAARIFTIRWPNDEKKRKTRYIAKYTYVRGWFFFYVRKIHFVFRIQRRRKFDEKTRLDI